MKLKPQDATYEAYERRRSGMLKQAILEKWTMDQKRAWLKENSPWTDSERLANLRRALWPDAHQN